MSDNQVSRKEVKKRLKSSCRGVLEDLLENVGFNAVEQDIFARRYMQEEEVLQTCYDLYISPSTYNKAHNNILDKVSSYFSYIN